MTTEQSSRSRVKQWVQSHIEDRDEVRIPDVVNEAIEAFSADKKFLRALALESLRDMVYEQARQTIRSSRELFGTGDGAMTRAGVQEKVKTHSVFAGWLEHAGDRHVRLMEMTREDLLLAADERDKRGTHEIQLATLWRTIANGLEGGQTVGTRYSTMEIEQIAENIERN